MSSPWAARAAAFGLAAGLSIACPVTAAEGARTLRVCADPNNLPYSDEQQRGFENRIAEILALQLDAELEYVWWAQRGKYLRNTIEAGICDVLIGVPADFERLLTTRPYYRSGYMFVTRRDDALALSSLDDPRLRTLRVGVQLITDEATSPPAHALAERGVTQNVRGYLVYGNYGEPEPISPIVKAVANREIDVALVWGPQAGFFAARQRVPLTVAPIMPESDGPARPMTFAISVGVRPGDEALRRDLDEALAARRADIDRVLDDYHVPRSASLSNGGAR
jgi:mxaJ protein